MMEELNTQTGIGENSEYLGEMPIEDIFSYMITRDLLEESQMNAGLYLLGNAGGTMGAGIVYEVENNYDLKGMKLNIRYFNSATVDFRAMIKKLPEKYKKIISTIPVGVKDSEYNKYLELWKKKRLLQAQLEQAMSHNQYETARRIQMELSKIKREIRAIQRKLSGSGSMIDVGLSKFQESYSLIESYLREHAVDEDVHLIIGSFSGGTGSALFIEISKLLKKINPYALRIAYGLTPFKSERKRNSLRVKNYIRSIQGTRPNVNLLIKIDPSKVSEQLAQTVGKDVNFIDLNREFGRRNAQFLLTLMLTNTADEFSQVTQDFNDLRMIVGDNAVGDINFYNNRTVNGGFMPLIDTVKQKVIPDMMKMPSRILIFYDIPKEVTVPEVEKANTLIMENTDATVYFGVTQRVGNDKEIRMYIVAIRDDDETVNINPEIEYTETPEISGIDDISKII